MTDENGIERIVDSLRTAISEIPQSIQRLTRSEVCGEAANGAIRVFYSPLAELNRIEIEPDFLRSSDGPRLEADLLEAFRRAEAAADRARDEGLGELTFMGIPIGRIVQGSAIADIAPPPDRIKQVLDQQKPMKPETLS